MHNHFLGFKSISDLTASVIGTKVKALALMDVLLALVATSLSIIPFIEQWIWSPAYSLVFYFIILIGDFISGLAVGVIKRKEGFLTQKAQRLPIIMVCHLILLGVAYNLGRVNNDLGVASIGVAIFDSAARVIYFYVIGVNFFSFIKNITLLGYLKGEIGTFIMKYIDKQKNILEDHESNNTPAA